MSGSAADPVALGGRSEFAAGSAQRDRRIAALVPWWPLLAILLLAAALRLSTLGLQSFWYDEAFTPVHVLRAGLGATLHNVVHTENTPPLWYVLEWGFSRVLGTGVVALRLLSALAGIATVAVAWAIGSELAGRRAAIVTATLVAVNPLFVWYSQEARAYGLFVFTASLALLCFLRACATPTNRRLAEFALTASLALLTHYFAVFLLIPMALWLLWLAIAGGWSDESAMPRARGGHRRIRRSGWRPDCATPRERTSNPKNLARVLCALALPALVGLALIPLILAQGGHGTQWIGEWALASRLEAIPQYYLTGYSGSSLGHGIELLVALLMLGGRPVRTVVHAHPPRGAGRADRADDYRRRRAHARPAGAAGRRLSGAAQPCCGDGAAQRAACDRDRRAAHRSHRHGACGSARARLPGAQRST